MLEALATVGIIAIGCVVEGTMTAVATLLNIRIVEHQFQLVAAQEDQQ